MKAIVIGAGFGGLAAAVRLRARGYEVEILEANMQAGGRASTWVREGLSFDAGPTVITAPQLFAELFHLLGRDPADYYELLPVDPFYRVHFPDGESFDYTGDEDRLLANVEAFSPGDVDGYRRMAAMSERIFDKGYTELSHVPFDTVSHMMRAVPDMLRLRSDRSVYSMVSTYIKDERLRQVFTFQPLLIGGNPFRASSIYLLIHWLERKWGVWYARGGTTALVRALVDVLAEVGVPVRLGTPVERIEVEGGRTRAVITEDGRRIPCDLVVSNADPSTTYRLMIAPEHRRTNTDRRVERVRQSMSLYVMYFGTEGTYDGLAHHNIVLGPRYKELLGDIFDKRVLADDFSLYLHRPATTDPTLQPAGKDGFYVLSPVPNQKSGLDWDAEAEGYGDRILESLEQRLMPGLRDRLITKFSVDPRYFEGHLRSVDGAAFGPEPTLTQSAWFRYHNRSEDVEGLYFVGAGTHPGAGVPGVLSGAKVLDKVVPDPSVAVPLPRRHRVSA